jgi:hypothetical protein
MAASSLADRPSTTKLLFRFRCPETETPVPGSPIVSAKRSAVRGWCARRGGEEREIEIVAPVERQAVDLGR